MGEQKEYSVKQASAAIGAPAHVVKYFCREGLVRDVKYADNGYRRFNAEQVAWMRLLNCLREAGSSLGELKTYAGWKYADYDTKRAQSAFLGTKKRQLWQKIEDLQADISLIEAYEEILLK